MWRPASLVLGLTAICGVIALILMNREHPAAAKVRVIRSHLSYRNELANQIIADIDATLNWDGVGLDEGPWLLRNLVAKLLNEYPEYLTSKDKAALENAKSQLDRGWAMHESNPIVASGSIRIRFADGIKENGKLLTDAKASWHLVEAAVEHFCDTLELYVNNDCEWSEVEDAHKAVVAAFSDRMHDPAHPPELMTLINEAVSLAQPAKDSQ